MVVEIVDSGVASVITMWEFIKQIDKQLSTYNAKEHHFWIDGVYVSDIFLTSKTKDLLKNNMFSQNLDYCTDTDIVPVLTEIL